MESKILPKFLLAQRLDVVDRYLQRDTLDHG